jgi:hypothetical protein
MKRTLTSLKAVGSQGAAGVAAGRAFSEAELVELEVGHTEGLSTQEVVALFASRGEKLSEATFRKYVQLGLLPRSVRVGRKGKHRGSQGLYPAQIVRQIEGIRALMAQGYTMVDIQRELLCLRSDIDAVARQLQQVIGALSSAAQERAADGGDEVLARALQDARVMGEQLIEKLRAVEERLAMRARMARAAV